MKWSTGRNEECCRLCVAFLQDNVKVVKYIMKRIALAIPYFNVYHAAPGPTCKGCGCGTQLSSMIGVSFCHSSCRKLYRQLETLTL